MKIVCLGDSLTEGYNIDLSTRWTDALSKSLNISVINSGISGDTTAGMVGRFSSDVLSHSPTHLIIMGGTNDLYFDLDDNYIISNLKTIVRQASNKNITSIIGLPTRVHAIHNPDTGLFISEQNLIQRVDSFRERLRAFAEDDGLSVIDFDHGLDRAHFLDDGVHPNEVAQGIMAEGCLGVFGVGSAIKKT